MPVCPNGCQGHNDESVELEFGFDHNHKAAYICLACGYRDLETDLQFDLCAA